VNETLQAGWINTGPAYYEFTVTSGFSDLDNHFYNFQWATVIVWKYEDADGNLATTNDWTAIDWAVTLKNGTWPAGQSFALGADGTITFDHQAPGTVTVTEADDPAYSHLNATTTWTQQMQSGQTYTVIFVNHYLVKFVKEFTSSGNLTGYTAPVISPDHLSSYVSQTKTGPAIWWVITYTVTNEENVGHYYIVWDKWGGNLMVLGGTPTAFTKPMLTLSNHAAFSIDPRASSNGYKQYVNGSNLIFSFVNAAGLGTNYGTAYVTLHSGDQQQGTNPGKGKGTTNDGKSYDLDVRWEIGWLDPGETATFTIIVAPGMNPGGQLEFTSTGINVINTGPVVRVYKYSDPLYANTAFLYTVPITNQLTVYVVTPMPAWMDSFSIGSIIIAVMLSFAIFPPTPRQKRVTLKLRKVIARARK
jgi:hypothetical protein